jgi:hypothetical protein
VLICHVEVTAGAVTTDSYFTETDSLRGASYMGSSLAFEFALKTHLSLLSIKRVDAFAVCKAIKIQPNAE